MEFEISKSSSYLNPVAEAGQVDSGILIKPESAYPLRDSQKFFCPDCDCTDPERILFPVRERDPFFRHRGDYSHEIYPETLLHKSAIKWFIGKTEYEIPALKTSDYDLPCQVITLDPDKTVPEYRRLQNIIPDVKVCSVNGFDFAIEIVVTNDINDPKKKLIEQFGLPVIRVDLGFLFRTFPDQCRHDLDFITAKLPKLMTDPELKSWVLPPSYALLNGKVIVNKIEPKPPSTDNDVGCLLAIVTLGLIYLFRGRD